MGLNGGIYSGFKINHLDITPRFAGILMSFTNCTANLAGLLAPIAAGNLIEGNVSQLLKSFLFWLFFSDRKSTQNETHCIDPCYSNSIEFFKIVSKSSWKTQVCMNGKKTISSLKTGSNYQIPTAWCGRLICLYFGILARYWHNGLRSGNRL